MTGRDGALTTRVVHDFLASVEDRRERHRLLAVTTELVLDLGNEGEIRVGLESVVSATERLLRIVYGPSAHFRAVLDRYAEDVLWAGRERHGSERLLSFRRLWGVPPALVVPGKDGRVCVPLPWVRRVLLWALQGIVCVQFSGGLRFVLSGEADRCRYAFLRPSSEATKAEVGIELDAAPLFWTPWRSIPFDPRDEA